MAYYTGIAQTPEVLLSALHNACLDNGWSLNNNILSKNGCYVKTYVNGVTIVIQGAIDNIFGICSGTASYCAVATDISYPLTYHVHVHDLEVYSFINFNVDRYSYLSFGQSPIGGIPGTGNWISGTCDGRSRISDTSLAYQDDFCHMMFSQRENNRISTSSFFHHGIDGQWSGTGKNEVNSKAVATLECYPAMSYQPNKWNGEAILIPIRPVIYRPQQRRTIVGQLRHAFYIRIDNYEPLQIISIGNRKYKIYPWIRKNTENRSFSGSAQTSTLIHSGTYGVAVSYDGD
ncbi:hypothetical protein DES39_0354 [Orbus hercynius]|uniref:Uncharacterized protein n=1 Tax=Orbus hercynius TaxID=593135 RepID=A0A495RIG8_9GAMM|nr:hypothetical protein [Orbus hercynius]RKS87139.1 hypothetical protein DES39_0354 [Orbus hercynius]